MFANLVALFSRRQNDHAFVNEVEVRERVLRSRPLERVLVWGWAFIAAKSVFTFWAHARYGLPFHPGWLVWPSAAFGALCTGIYLWRIRR